VPNTDTTYYAKWTGTGENAIDETGVTALLGKHGISGTPARIAVMKKINDYYKNDLNVKSNIDSGLTTVFAFEGAGVYAVVKDDKNPYHPNGRYGAMMVVMKGKEVVYITARASTLPDNPAYGAVPGKTKDGSAVVKEGVYSYHSGKHQGKYPALKPDGVQQGYYTDGKATWEGDVVGANIHAGGDGFPNWSTACQIIHYTEYVEFGLKAGFLNTNAIGIALENGNANALKDPVVKEGEPKITCLDNVNVTYVLDRSCMPGDQKDAFKL
jgi:hypothetical protein